MPFPKWAVEPVFLSRHNVPPDKSEPGNFLPVTQATLVGCLRQLASVVRIADHIFYEIGCECRALADKAERLRAKVDSCQEAVDGLNARAVKVPISDLNTASRLLRTTAPFRTEYGQAGQLFLPASRPPCVDRLYGLAAPTPAALLRGLTADDGRAASDLFVVTPVVAREGKRKRVLDVETWKPANCTVERRQECVAPSRGYLLRQTERELELERLPSPEEQAMLVALEFPSTVVPVDTTGNNFSRMSLLRRSLMHADFVIKRKKGSSKKRSKRRHTICEGTINRTVTDTSCQTDDMLSVASSSLPRRRSRSVHDTTIDTDSCKKEDVEKDKSPSKSGASPSKKSKGWYSSLSAALSSVKLRSGGRRAGDDGRSSSGNWSASSSARASVDDSASPSRNSLGKDSLLSAATDPHHHDNRSRDDILPIQSLTCSPVKKKKFPPRTSPFAPRRPLPADDGDSSVYSVDTDGYYTSMHTDSGLWRREDEPPPVEEEEDDEESVNSFLSSAADRRTSTSESSDVDVRERILQKTAITRYPSMCAVSPETSDEDEAAFKRRTVVLAEVHPAPSVDMFRSETPLPSGFSASLLGNASLRRTSTPRTSTFDPVVVSDPPASPSPSDKSLIPLKYAQRITVTPISRAPSDVKPPSLTKQETRTPILNPLSSSDVKTSKLETRTPLKPLSSNEVITKPETPTSSNDVKPKQDTSPSYVSFSAPDSPVSVVSFTLDSKPTSPTNSLTRPVARVTLDPTGKVVYSSNSLERPGGTVSPCKSNLENRPYSTIPKYQTNLNRSPAVQNGVSRDQINRSSFSMRDSKNSLSNINRTMNGSSHSNIGKSADGSNRALHDQSRSSTPVQSRISISNVDRASTPVGQIYETVDSNCNPDRSSTPIKDVLYRTPTSLTNMNRSAIPTTDLQNRTLSSQTYMNRSTTPTTGVQYRTPTSQANMNRSATPTTNVQYRTPTSQTNINRSATPTTDNQYRTPISQTNMNRSFTPIMDGQSRTLISQTNINRSSTPTSDVQHRTPASQNNVSRSSTPIKDVQYRTPLRQANIIRSSTPLVEEQNSTSEGNNRSIVISSSDPKPSDDVPSRENSFPTYSSSSLKSGKDFTFRPSRGGRFCRSYFPSHLISSPSSVHTRDSAGQSPPQQQSPVPNVTKHPTPQSRIWPSRLQQQQHPVVKQPDHRSSSLSPPDLIPSGESPPSTLDITSPANSKSLKSLSANELFAIIHSSKRKLNIRTEADLSLSSPASSRSASPALSLSRVETGSLDRRSAPSSTPSAPRTTPVAKPTSLRDFKLLLLQSRADGGVPRPSAAELLKVSPPRASPRPVQTTTRRRTRSPYSARYDSAYPPIIEDCSEEEADRRSLDLLQTPAPPPAKATSTWV